MMYSVRQRLVALVVSVTLLIFGVVILKRPDTTVTALGSSAPAQSMALQLTTPTADLLRGQDLVYACPTGGNYDLCLVPGDGSPEINLTNTPSVSESWPTWSPDGTRIAYSARAADAPVMSVFMPTNSFIRVARVPTTADLLGGATIQVSPETPPRGFMPAWSRTGKFLTFSRWHDEAETYNRAAVDLVLAVVRVADDRIVELGPARSGHPQYLTSAWTADDRILWHEGVGQAPSSPRAPLSNLFAAPRSTDIANARKLTNVDGLSGLESLPGALEPDVSPDGRTITFISCEQVLQLNAGCSFASRSIATMPVNGGDRTYVLDDGNGPRTPKWSPDSSMIAYSDKFGIQIYRVDSGTSESVSGSGVGAITPAWRPSPQRSSTVRPVGADGATQYFFDRGEPVSAAVDTLGADRVVVCLFSAVGPVNVSTVSRCFPAVGDSHPVFERSEAMSGTVTWTVPLGIPEPGGDVSSALQDLPAGRWVIGVDRFDSSGLVSSEFSQPFSITCATSTCETIPFKRWSDRFQNIAELMARIQYLNTVTCWALELTLIGLTVATSVNPLTASINAVFMSQASQLVGLLFDDVSKYLFQTSAGLFELAGMAIGPGALTEMIQNVKQSSDPVAQQRARDVEAASGGYNRASQAAGLAVGTICFALEQAFTAAINVLQLASDFFAGCADDITAGLCPAFLVGIQPFAGPRGLRQTTQEVGGAPVRPPDVDEQSASASAHSGSAESTGVTPRAHSDAARLLNASLESPTIDTTMPGEIATALTTFALTREAVGNLNTALASLAAPTPGEVDVELGTAEDAVRDLLTVADTMGSLATALEYDTQAEGRAVDEPLIEPSLVSLIDDFQARLRTSGLTPSERQLLADVGLSPTEIDDLVAGWEQRPIDPAELGRSTADVASEISGVAGELAAELRGATLDLSEGIVAVSTGPIVEDATVVGAVGEQVSLLAPAFDPNGGDLAIEIVDTPTSGSTQVLYDEFSYVPEPGFVGTDTFTFVARSDRGVVSDVATITVEVLPTPPTPVGDQFGVRQGTSLNVPAPGVLGNDVTTNLPLTASMVGPPRGGRLDVRARRFVHLRTRRHDRWEGRLHLPRTVPGERMVGSGGRHDRCH